jgi:hypothetical protein
MKFAYSQCFGGIYLLHLQGKNKPRIKPAEASSKMFLRDMGLSPNNTALQHRRLDVVVFKFSGNHSSHLRSYLSWT